MSCVYFSLVSRDKGAECVLDAASVTPGVDFHLYGPVAPDFKTDFCRRVESQANVTYHGVFDPSAGDAASELALYDVHLLPTRYPNEGVPGAIVESKFAGIPTITTDSRWMRDIVHDGSDGILLRGQDACALACAVRAYDTDRKALARAKDAAWASSERYCADLYVDGIAAELTGGAS